MWTLLKNLGRKLIYDELAVRRWIRAGMLFVGTSGVAFADQVAQLIESPESVRKIKIIGVVCAAIGGAITAGERNRPVADAQEQPPA